MPDYKSYGQIEIGDKTLSKRVEKTLNQLGSNPEASISSACKNPHQAKAVYRLLSNSKFGVEPLLAISRQETIRRISESGAKVVLLPQDTTTLNYSGLKQTEGLGSISRIEKNSGILLHSSIAVAEDGQPLGLLATKMWTRPKEEMGKKSLRKQLPISEKESNKWLETLDSADIRSALPDVQFIHLCDREGDLYEFFAKAYNDDASYICRRAQNRVVLNKDSQESTLINEFLESLPVAGKIAVEVPDGSHKKRNAMLEVKYGTISIAKPATLSTNKSLPGLVEVTLVMAQEVHPPKGTDAISWHLVTNAQVNTFDEAITCVQRYTKRWKIETFHYVLKSGCKIEKQQSDSVEKLMKLVALYSIIALQIMILTFMARTNPDQSCEVYFEEADWKILYKVANKTKSLPATPPTIKDAVLLVAKLGGFLARKSDGDPGVTVIWRGLSSLSSILDAALFLA